MSERIEYRLMVKLPGRQRFQDYQRHRRLDLLQAQAVKWEERHGAETRIEAHTIVVLTTPWKPVE